MKRSTHVPIRRYTPKQLAVFYDCSVRTIERSLQRLDIGEKIGHFYSTHQVKDIFKKMGPP